MLWLTLAAEMSASIPGSSIVSEFQKFCVPPGASVQTVLAHADQDGWRKGGAGTPADFDPATQRLKDTDHGLLKLAVTTTLSRDSQELACGLSNSLSVPNLVPTMQAYLGFAPFLNMGTATTFYAVRSGTAWQSGAALSRPDFLKAQTEGRFYSIVVGSTETSSTIVELRVIPSKAPLSPRDPSIGQVSTSNNDLVIRGRVMSETAEPIPPAYKNIVILAWRWTYRLRVQHVIAGKEQRSEIVAIADRDGALLRSIDFVFQLTRKPDGTYDLIKVDRIG